MLLAFLREHAAGPLCIAALHALALAVFVHGFLLTRVRLEQRSTTPGPLPAPRNKLVWLMVDSLRYDFVISDGRYSCRTGALCHQERMPLLSNLTSKVEVARAFRFVADPPTTTTQRLKSLMTGGLPSFFDISSSFTAGQVNEDNLIDQLVAGGRRLAFMGDATWSSLFPTQFAAGASPFPCFNIKDLHTVDDGVWGLLPPALAAPGNWDVLIAHYLGVDHAGHTHGVDSQEMAEKLAQMDAHVWQVAEAMARGAGPGGEYERALLLVSGDHGQTLSGDHGGGSPEEVDSALVAINPFALRSLLLQPSGSSSSSSSSSSAGSYGSQQSHRSSTAQPGSLWGPAPCRANCSCGPDSNQCAADLPQTDLAPTLSALLGVPLPFGNVGKVSPELWGFAAAQGGQAGAAKDSSGGPDADLAAVLQANVEQVHTYLNTYASTSGASFSRAALRGINSLFTALAADIFNSTASEADQNMRRLAFLEAAAALAREQWTQFDDLPMLAGLLLFAAALLIHAMAAFGGMQHPCVSSKAASHEATVAIASSSKGHCPSAGVGAGLVHKLVTALVRAGLLRWPMPHSSWPVPTMAAVFISLVAVHVLGIFSFFFLLSEGSKLCHLLGATFVLLAASTSIQCLRPPAPSPRPTTCGQHSPRAPAPAGPRLALQAMLLGALLVSSNAAMASWGLASHSGLAFWHRLTVHPTEATELAEEAADGEPAAASPAGLMGRGLAAMQAGLLSLPGVQGALSCTRAGSGMLCLLPISVLAAAAQAMLGRFALPGGGSRVALQLQRLLLAAAFASVAAYHCLEQLAQQGTLKEDTTAGQLLGRWQLGAGFARAAKAFVAAPLRLLLPRLTYSLCVASLLLWALQQAQRQLYGWWRCLPFRQSPAAASSDLARMAAGAVGLQGPLLAVLLQVSNAALPWLLLLGAAQLWAAVQLLRLRALQHARSAGTGAAAAAGMLEAGALLGMLQAQAFFTTGHLCEFAGLQYLAGFVGYDEFHLLRSAALLVINTFGAMVLVALALPAAVCTLEAATASNAGPPSILRQASQQATAPGRLGWRRALVAFLLVRACTAFAATLSAGVQRRHLYAWSLFAPKFAFELAWLLGTDALVSLLCLVI